MKNWKFRVGRTLLIIGGLLLLIKFGFSNSFEFSIETGHNITVIATCINTTALVFLILGSKHRLNNNVTH